ncbi:MAG: hypothetical protein FE835_19965, partial [Gammaproteobacteria bacterium]|nr:hypothetical protein [Gammaproteobacteria bacterium]
GMLRAAYAYCGLPAFVSLSMAGSGGDTTAYTDGCYRSRRCMKRSDTSNETRARPEPMGRA